MPVITAEKDTFDIDRVMVVAQGHGRLELEEQDTDVFNQLVRHLQRFVIRGDRDGRHAYYTGVPTTIAASWLLLLSPFWRVTFRDAKQRQPRFLP
ncbi:hypothetical protein SAMN05216312_114198 [Cohnella sp. OV330]|nr:hypothetical protein SAMN05216312_114198 [Cohnella sp. OV330]